MTLLAEEARKLSEKWVTIFHTVLIFSYHLIQFYLTFFCGSLHRHKADADQIEKIAKDANDTSTKAYNMLKKALDGENKTNSDIDELNRKYVVDITFYATFLSCQYSVIWF